MRKIHSSRNKNSLSLIYYAKCRAIFCSRKFRFSHLLSRWRKFSPICHFFAYDREKGGRMEIKLNDLVNPDEVTLEGFSEISDNSKSALINGRQQMLHPNEHKQAPLVSMMEIAQAFDQAGSKGTFLASTVKGHYRYSRSCRDDRGRLQRGTDRQRQPL